MGTKIYNLEILTTVVEFLNVKNPGPVSGVKCQFSIDPTNVNLSIMLLTCNVK